jgi:hypothetical protein
MIVPHHHYESFSRNNLYHGWKQQVQQQVPRQPPMLWHYTSNHVMVNQERVKRLIPSLIRCKELDRIARDRTEQMVQYGTVRPQKEKMIRIKEHRRMDRYHQSNHSILVQNQVNSHTNTTNNTLGSIPNVQI